jgi:hypothetical protein
VSHFSSLGFADDTPEQMEETVGRAVELASPASFLNERQDRHLWFQDGSGAAMGVHVSESAEVECITPFFAPAGGGARWRVRTRAPRLDAECPHCSGADCDVLDGAGGDMLTRATVQWLFFEPYRDWLAEPRELDLEMVGFASMLAVGETPEDLEPVQERLFGAREAGQPLAPGKPIRLAENAFLPYGMFNDGDDVGQRARALLMGTVSEMSKPTNALTGRRFVRLRVRTLGGDLDIVAPEGLVERPPMPSLRPKLALADVWLVGRPAL